MGHMTIWGRQTVDAQQDSGAEHLMASPGQFAERKSVGSWIIQIAHDIMPFSA